MKKSVEKILRRTSLIISQHQNYFVTIETASVCNLRCSFCPYPDSEKENKLMTIETFKEILNKLKAFPINNYASLTICPAGLGEPFLNKDIIDMLRLIRGDFPGAKIQIDSNFTVLNGDIIEVIVKENLLDIVGCSLNYFDSKLYNSLCGSDKLSSVINSIGVFCDTIKKYDSKLRISLAMKKHPDISSTEQKNIETKIFNQWGDGVVIWWNDILNWGGKVNIDSDSRLVFPCYGLFLNNLVIDMNGEIYPCCCALSQRFDNELSLGNIARTHYSDIEAKLKRLRSSHLNQKWDEIALCSKCNFYGFEYYNCFFKVKGRYW